MEIVNLFYELARQHLLIRGFRYDRTYEKGSGSDMYPLVWLDDPILGQSARLDGGVIKYTANVDILGIPNLDSEVLPVQSAAFLTGLSFNERIKELKGATGISVETFSFISLREYYDDKAAGFRFTYVLNAVNPINRCENFYDPDKKLEKVSLLPDFNTDKANGCAIFNDKKGLPNFSV